MAMRSNTICICRVMKQQRSVSVAVEEYGFTLQYASGELRNDKEVVMIAVKKCLARY